MATRPERVFDEVTVSNPTEKRLFDSALSLFSEKGYEGTSIREIIGRAGVTRPVLYYYFEGKEDLFRRLVDTWFTQFQEETVRILEGVEEFRARLLTLTEFTFECAQRVPEVVRLIFHVFMSPSMAGLSVDRDGLWDNRFQMFVGIMRDGIAEGLLANRDPKTLAMAFCGLVDYHILAEVNRQEGMLSRALASELVDLFIAGADSAGTNLQRTHE